MFGMSLPWFAWKPYFMVLIASARTCASGVRCWKAAWWPWLPCSLLSTVISSDLSVSPPTPLCFSRGDSFRTKSELRSALEDYGITVGDWQVSEVLDFSFLFTGYPDFNEDISGWDVSRGETLSRCLLSLSRLIRTSRVGPFQAQRT
jgi:hypothetical protein